MSMLTDQSVAGFRLYRVAWLALVLLIAVVWAAGVPLRLHALEQICAARDAWSTGDTPPGCVDQQLGPAAARSLAEKGLSPGFFAAYVTTIEVTFVLVFWSLGALIAFRRRRDPYALFVAFFLFAWGVSSASAPQALAALRPAWALPAGLVILAGGISAIVFLATFPDGHFKPRWVGPVAAGAVVLQAGLIFLPSSTLDSLRMGPVAPFLMQGAPLILLMVGQVLRYRAENAEQKRQTRWAVFGLLGAIASLGVLSALVSVLPKANGTLAFLLGDAAWYVASALIPLGIALAILRSRLFDIDIIIRRTLIYSILTALLAGVYFGSVLLLEQVSRALFAGQQQVAIVLSTLAIAGLFTPLRRRVQNVVDRRFYRRKYDAARELAAFGAVVRDEVELGRLAERLVAVVEDTMQPVHVSLWLPEPPRRTK